MRMIFVRLNEKDFYLCAGRKNAIENSILSVCWCELRRFNPIQIKEESRDDKYRRDTKFVDEVTRFAQNNRRYVFWEIFDFWEGRFSYAAKKEVFFEQKKEGATLEDAIEEMKKRSLL